MGLVISTNIAAAFAARQVEKNNDGLIQSLNRLSSGQRIVNPYDDAGGMAVQLKMQAAVKRGAVAKNNIQNAISLLQTQDGILQTATRVVDRIAELKAMSQDSTKNAEDLQNYNEEYQVLRQQLLDLQTERFKSVSMFGSFQDTDTAVDNTNELVFKIYTTEQGRVNNSNQTGPSVMVSGVYLAAESAGAGVTDLALVTHAISSGFSGAVASFTSGGLADSGLTMDGILSDLQKLANARAQNGALQSRLNFSYDQASISKTNLEAARSRIIDVDIAEESSNFARQNIMMQASSSMLAQANNTSRTALQILLQG
jgi:flagellin